MSVTKFSGQARGVFVGPVGLRLAPQHEPAVGRLSCQYSLKSYMFWFVNASFLKTTFLYLFVYVGFANEALCLCLFCTFEKQSSSCIFLYSIKSKNKTKIFSSFFAYGKQANLYQGTKLLFGITIYWFYQNTSSVIFLIIHFPM